VASGASAHDPSAAPITWNREISRIVYEHCVSCHREGGTSFPLVTYQDAQPHASAIKDSVLSRRMPPWGAVKGFRRFRNDQSLTQEQIALIADWVEGGITRGNNPRRLPALPKFDRVVPFAAPGGAIAVSGPLTLSRSVTVDGVWPERVPDGVSMQIVAVRPDGDIEPLIWLYEYRNAYRHPFLFRAPVVLPAGTVIRGVRPDARLSLIPVANATRESR